MATQKAQDKPKIFTMICKQFPLAILGVVERCDVGHKKYPDLDYDYQGFSRLPIEEYEEAILRHLMQLGEEGETELDHARAVAWNALVLLELKLRKDEKNL